MERNLANEAIEALIDAGWAVCRRSTTAYPQAEGTISPMRNKDGYAMVRVHHKRNVYKNGHYFQITTVLRKPIV